MEWTGSYNLAEMYEGDYGNGINFGAFDFEIGDTIVINFENNIINPKLYVVDTNNYNFEFVLTKEESNKLSPNDYRFSIKQYRNNEFLKTLVNGILRVKETNKWQ